MLIAVPRERASEARVALTPAVVRRLADQDHDVAVEPGAGEGAWFGDDAYRDAGAEVATDAVEGADLTTVVGPPSTDLIARLPAGSAIVGFLEPFSPDLPLDAFVEQQITAFAMETVPRTTLAQSMDALSSQASAAGYHAVLLAAAATPRFFPMLMTAAGTIPPVRLLVLGAGVAGLQAIATGRRLGAIVSAYDIRPEVREQIESLGARFVTAPVTDTADGGYAAEVGDDTQRRQHEALTEHVAAADVVITTAQVPGRPAPLLITTTMIERMRPGSVVVDLAAGAGGNCELTRPGEDVTHDGVRIMGPTDLAARVAVDASETYARNLEAFIARLSRDGRLAVDLDDEIVGGACLTHGGRIIRTGLPAAADVGGIR